MHLSRLFLDNFRNYRNCSVEFEPNGALFYGLNGSGKTNLLEAIFFLCTSRSQRQSSRVEMINFKSEYGYVEGGFFEEKSNREIAVSAGFSRDKKVSMKVDGNALSSLSQWFGRAAVIPFGPDDINLIQGLPGVRRTFLDLLLCQMDQVYMKNLGIYKKNCAQRNAILSMYNDDVALDIYEQNMAVSGAAVSLKRQEIISFMKPHFSGFYAEISGNCEEASIEYKPSIRCDLSTQTEWENVFYNEIKNARYKDVSNGFSSIGIHRDDLSVCVDGKPAKLFASQGQCTTLTLSLRMCSILCCEAYKKETMLFLFDDALTYLDEGRTRRVFPLVKSKGQVFMATSSMQETAVRDIPLYIVKDGMVVRR